MDFVLLAKILFAWNVAGILILAILWVNLCDLLDKKSLLHPSWLYRKFRINYFGCGLLTLIFNLLCPVVSIIHWICEFLYFVCTVGREQDNDN